MGQPTFMYRRKDGNVESKVFDSDAIPEGWVDTPTKLPPILEPTPKPKPKGNSK